MRAKYFSRIGHWGVGSAAQKAPLGVWNADLLPFAASPSGGGHVYGSLGNEEGH
jgi:hypothetical protein